MYFHRYVTLQSIFSLSVKSLQFSPLWFPNKLRTTLTKQVIYLTTLNWLHCVVFLRKAVYNMNHSSNVEGFNIDNWILSDIGLCFVLFIMLFVWLQIKIAITYMIFASIQIICIPDENLSWPPSQPNRSFIQDIKGHKICLNDGQENQNNLNNTALVMVHIFGAEAQITILYTLIKSWPVS